MWRGLRRDWPKVTESEDARLEGAKARLMPSGARRWIGRDRSRSASHGCEGFADAGAVLVESLLLIGGEKTDLAGEAVAVGVEAGAMLAFFGFGTGGMLGVGQVGE